jgi:hypothetical protein
VVVEEVVEVEGVEVEAADVGASAAVGAIARAKAMGCSRT